MIRPFATGFDLSKRRLNMKMKKCFALACAGLTLLTDGRPMDPDNMVVNCGNQKEVEGRDLKL